MTKPQNISLPPNNGDHSLTRVMTTRDLDSLLSLNLGAGSDIHSDMINLDLRPLPGIDIVHDIKFFWPFPSSRFTSIHANHILEHCPNLIFQLNQAWRVLKDQGTLFISVPWWSGTWARGDPEHIRQFDHNSFAPFSTWYARYAYLGIKGPWLLHSQDFYTEPDNADPHFFARFGFSRILSMSVVLKKP